MNSPEEEKQLPVDGKVSVAISQDTMQAVLTIDPPLNGGKLVTADMIRRELKKSSVTYGINQELIDELEKKPVYSKEIVIAKGLAPVNGEDGAVAYQFETSVNIRPKVLEDGSVDYRDLGLIQNVHKGQVLCKIKQPTLGSEGYSVTGRKISQRTGAPVPSVSGRNTELNKDQTMLLAAIDGHVSLNGAQVNVNDTFVVKENVDNSTGNIRFVGNVVVNGYVSEGFLVEAGGNIDVNRSVQGANIKAEGNITIRGGVVGMERSIIECKGNLSSTFLENCEVHVDGSIKAENLMNSFVTCGGTIELTGPRARLIGGKCIAGEDIIADVIGTPANIPTELVLGVDPKIIGRYRQVKEEMKQYEQQIVKLGQITTLLEKYEAAGALPPDKKALLESARGSVGEYQNHLNTLTQELGELTEKITASGKGRVVCKGVIYRGVKITIGIASCEMTDFMQNVMFYNKEDKIETGTAF